MQYSKLITTVNRAQVCSMVAPEVFVLTHIPRQLRGDDPVREERTQHLGPACGSSKILANIGRVVSWSCCTYGLSAMNISTDCHRSINANFSILNIQMMILDQVFRFYCEGSLAQVIFIFIFFSVYGIFLLFLFYFYFNKI